MKTYVETVILSHLSDASIEITHNPELAKKRMQFVRLLVATYPNTETIVSKEILDEIWISVNK